MAKLFTILVLLACACSSDDDAADSGPGDTPRDADIDRDADVDAAGDGGDGTVSVLPETLLLEGTAEAHDGDDRVECHFDGMMTDLERAPNGEISAQFIGEIFRTTFPAAACSSSRRWSADRRRRRPLRLRRRVALRSGPLGQSGFMDIDLTAEGTWTLIPAR